jgi:predicted flap endonuclease-1-like 5' DNA nuclease
VGRRRTVVILAALVALVVGVVVWLRPRPTSTATVAPEPSRPVPGGTGRPAAPKVAPATGSPLAAHALAEPAGPEPEPARGLEPVDDLKAVRGIGPALERRLQEAGVTSLRQLAALDDTGAAALAARLGPQGARLRRDDWPGQAARLLATRGRPTT